MPTRRLEVGDEAAGERLDAFLSGPLGSRSRAARLIDAGLVTVDGAARARHHRVVAGERVEVAEREAQPVATEPVAFTVAYEDEAVLVVDKPAGVVVHPGAGVRGPTLVDALAGRVAGGCVRNALLHARAAAVRHCGRPRRAPATGRPRRRR